VFDRFWRADPSRVRTVGGSGLGLSISLEDARLHGGWLQVWGQPGHGAQFRLTVPLVLGGELTSSPLPLRPAVVRRPAGLRAGGWLADGAGPDETGEPADDVRDYGDDVPGDGVRDERDDEDDDQRDDERDDEPAGDRSGPAARWSR
jgi:hypothetical protein